MLGSCVVLDSIPGEALCVGNKSFVSDPLVGISTDDVARGDG